MNIENSMPKTYSKTFASMALKLESNDLDNMN